MAVSQTRTLLPLDTFARIAGIHPLHFNQIALPDLAPDAPDGQCDSLLCQYSWQHADKTGREEIAQAIADAEEILALNLGFPVSAQWIADEQTLYPRPSNPALYSGNGLDVRGFPVSLRASYGYVQYGGKEAVSLIEAASPITYTDTDGDGYKETATVVVSTTVTDEEEVSAFYPNKAGSYAWEIRPVTVSIVAGVATITFQRAQCLLPELLESLSPVGANGSDDANFLTTVDVYRHYNDPSVQAQLIWQGESCCELESCTACGLSVQTGCLAVRDHRLGMVAPSAANWNGTGFDGAYFTACRAPDRLRLWYRAGWKASDSYLKMDPMWARTVTYLALSMLDRPLCSCEALSAFVAHWSEDLGMNKSSPALGTSVQLGPLVKNPIGTTRGAIYAWRMIQRYQLGEAA